MSEITLKPQTEQKRCRWWPLSPESGSLTSYRPIPMLTPWRILSNCAVR